MVIGMVGGMGSYATLDIFRRYLSEFPAEKEWDRPRIIIDNNCTMPSRVLAALYGTKREQLISEMTESVRGLLASGCTHMFLGCNTAHIFLDEVLQNVPEAKEKMINLIEVCAQDISGCGEKMSLALVATEGTVETGIYQKTFQKYGIEIVQPNQEKYLAMRDVIEAVKQNKVTEQTVDDFCTLLESFGTEGIVLGCTEFPVLYSHYRERVDGTGIRIFDPIDALLKYLRAEYGREKRDE